MIILGIVGAPAGGKSTVASYLEGLGAAWINADRIARGVLEEQQIQHQLIEHFGSEIANTGGGIDRTKLASLVFGDDEANRVALTYLEGLIHPRTRLIIIQQLRQLERQGICVAVLDVPLLFKGGWDRWCDEIWCIDSDFATRLERARSRGWNEAQLRMRESNQLSMDQKRRRSTWVIDNNESLQQLHKTLDGRWDLLLKRQRESVANPDRHCHPTD